MFWCSIHARRIIGAWQARVPTLRRIKRGGEICCSSGSPPNSRKTEKIGDVGENLKIVFRYAQRRFEARTHRRQTFEAKTYMQNGSGIRMQCGKLFKRRGPTPRI